MIRLKVGPQTATVSGSHYRTGSAVWRGLKISEAEPRAQSSMMVAVCGADRAPIDIHLQSPFRDHDDDGLDATVFYRIRPKMEAGKKWKGRMVDFVCFEKIDGEWWIAVKLGDNNVSSDRGADRARWEGHTLTAEKCEEAAQNFRNILGDGHAGQ